MVYNKMFPSSARGVGAAKSTTSLLNAKQIVKIFRCQGIVSF